MALLIEHFCKLCGNVQVTKDGDICNLCQPFIDGPLRMAYDAWLYVEEHWGRCCGGLSSDISFGRTLEERVRKFSPATHLSLHPNEHGHSSYTLDGTSEPTISVDCGIDFYADHATCHWVFDNDAIETSDIAIKDLVSYAQAGESFLAMLAGALDASAQIAYMSDYAQCAECGGHYFAPNGPCCEGGDPEGDAELAEMGEQ